MDRIAVFLDRDGVIARDVHYCRRIEDFEILPGVPEAIKLLNKYGFKVIVVTNQSGIARGYFTEHTLFQIHQKMRDEFAKYDARIDAIYYCPHHPDDGCECRKPKPKLLLEAARELGIELEHSYMVGDRELDIKAGKAAGCRTVLVATGPNPVESEMQNEAAEHIAADLFDAANWLIHDRKKD